MGMFCVPDPRQLGVASEMGMFWSVCVSVPDPRQLGVASEMKLVSK